MTYRIQSNIGKARHVVSFHDGVKTHGDGSPFFEVEIFSNMKDRDRFIARLKSKGYRPS